MSFKQVGTRPKQKNTEYVFQVAWAEKAGLTLHLGASLGLEIPSCWSLQLGEDEDVGRARMVRDDGGRTLHRMGRNRSSNTSGAVVHFGRVSELDPGSARDGVECLFEMSEDRRSITFALPVWEHKGVGYAIGGLK